MSVIVDSREPNRIVNSLKKKIKDVETEFLDVGDYLLDNGFAIERKDKDLIQSILSNRLYDQLNNLCEFDHPILCIVLDDIWKNFYFSRSRWIHTSYEGTLATLAVSYPKLKIFQFRTEDEFVTFMHNLDKKIHKEGPSTRPSPILRKGKKLFIRKEDALTAIDGVSIKKSKKLLECFGTIQNISNAKIEELEMVDGIGKKLAKNVYETLH